MLTMTSSYYINSPTYYHSLLPNIINFNLLWVNWVLDLDREKVLHILSDGTFSISMSSTIYTPTILLTFLVYRSSFISEQDISICFNTCFINEIVVLRKVTWSLFTQHDHKIIRCTMLYYILYVEKYLFILQVVVQTFEQYLYLISIIFKTLKFFFRSRWK